MAQALAIQYRPKSFSDLTEQSAVVTILTNQIETGTIKHGYLFCGPAGCGKTTSARIFANMINKGKGTPIELDAASNSSVEDIRKIIEQAQTKSLDSDYKVFIIDEVHSLSNQAFQALLKTLEEPPTMSIFILCTTNPERIPKTVLSRVQRYNFQKISHKGIVDRLVHIMKLECPENEGTWDGQAIDYIAKLSEGGMRDALTLLDKCLSFSNELTVENVIEALGVANYEQMLALNGCIFDKSQSDIITIITDIYNSGLDLKLFIKTYFEFILDINILGLTGDVDMTKIPTTHLPQLREYSDEDWETCLKLLPFLVDLQNEIKWEQNPKAVIIAKLIIFTSGE